MSIYLEEIVYACHCALESVLNEVLLSQAVLSSV